jgi:hypothetical protein
VIRVNSAELLIKIQGDGSIDEGSRGCYQINNNNGRAVENVSLSHCGRGLIKSNYDSIVGDFLRFKLFRVANFTAH